MHEWGTFTCLQNEQGEELGGINSDDEALPWFVHRVDWDGVEAPNSKGSPPCDPDITMRLETPVTYFHPPLNTTQTLVVDVSATFHGGVLTEYYPFASTQIDHVTTGALAAGFRITSNTLSSLHWNGVRVGDQADPLPTDYPVWLAPRKVGSAATLKVYKPGPAGSNPDDEGTTEGEVFLFYRGVGHMQSPLKVETADSVVKASIRTPEPFKVSAAWLLEVAPVGTLARFKFLGQLDSGNNRVCSGTLTQLPFGSSAQSDLRSQIREALNASGLNDDEAAAMLETWQRSYFESPGMRLFYLLPQSWTDEVLPLHLEGPARVECRVMMGRVELVTTHQREVLQRISKYPESSALQEADPRLPLYDQLGRFRNALLLDALRHNPTVGLQRFAKPLGVQSAAEVRAQSD